MSSTVKKRLLKSIFFKTRVTSPSQHWMSSQPFISHLFSPRCLMNVLMHHQYDLFQSRYIFLVPLFFFLFLCPFHRTVLPLPSVDCVIVQTHQTPSIYQQSWFLTPPLPSAGVTPCLACRNVIIRQPKVTPLKTEGPLLFVRYAILCCPLSSASMVTSSFPVHRHYYYY